MLLTVPGPVLLSCLIGCSFATGGPPSQFCAHNALCLSPASSQSSHGKEEEDLLSYRGSSFHLALRLRLALSLNPGAHPDWILVLAPDWAPYAGFPQAASLLAGRLVGPRDPLDSTL